MSWRVTPSTVAGLAKVTATLLPGLSAVVGMRKSAGAVLLTWVALTATPSTHSVISAPTPPAGTALARTVTVLVMFGAVLVLFFLPWLDTSKVRSAVYRPWYKLFFWLFVADCLMLGWLGSRTPTDLFTLMSQLGTLYYFSFFLIIMPVLGLVETPRRIPNSITEAVLEKNAKA